MDELPVKSLASVDSFHSRLDEIFDRLPASPWRMGNGSRPGSGSSWTETQGRLPSSSSPVSVGLSRTVLT